MAFYEVTSGVTTGIILNHNDILYVFSSGTANETTVNSGGSMRVSSGGTALKILENGGYVVCYTGANVSFISNEFSGIVLRGSRLLPVQKVGKFDYVSLHSGTTATDTIIQELGVMEVYFSGVANKTKISSDGMLYLSSGGTANNTTIEAGGSLYLSSGGTANNTTIEAGGSLSLSSGGTANKTTVSAGGSLIVSGGAIVNSTTVKSGGSMDLEKGASADYTVFSGGSFDVLDLRTLNNTTVKEATLNISSGGKVNTTTISKGSMTVFSSGTATDITVVSGGSLIIDNGGVVNSAMISSGCNVIVSNGGTANSVTLKKDVNLIVSKGITADYATVSSGGSMKVSSGATVNETTVKNGGSMTVAPGAAANRTAVNGEGAVLSVGLGTVNDTTVGDGGIVRLLEANANKTTVNEGGTLIAAEGGKATSTTVNSVGELHVSNAGSAMNTTVNSSGTLIVSAGALANITTVNEGGVLIVSGVASNTVLNGGAMYGSSNATVKTVDVNEGGYLYLYAGVKTAEGIRENGGYAEFEPGANVEFVANTFTGIELTHDSASVHSLTSAVNTTINEMGRLDVFSGGHATGLTVSNYGRLDVSSGAHIGGAMTFRDGAIVSVSAGATVNFDISSLSPSNTAIINNLAKIGTAPDFTLTVGGASQTEGDYRLAEGATGFDKSITVLTPLGGIIDTLTVNGESLEYGGVNYRLTQTGAILTVTAWKTVFTGNVANGTKNILSGMSAVNVNVNEKGILNISSGGVASSTNVNAGGSMNLFDGGEASNTTINQGVLHVKSGGVANDTDIYYAIANVSAGGIANRTTVNQDGVLVLYHQGTVSNTTVNKDGHFEVSNGGMTINTTVNKDGHLYIYSGGTATGQMNFADGASVSAYEGGIIDFDISALSPANAALLNNLSLVTGTPKYTLTVSGTQTAGTYNLAEGATGFSGTITVKNTLGTELGTLTVGTAEDIGSMSYTLALDGSVLSVSVAAQEVSDTVAPVISNIQADIDTETNQDVTVTAEFSDNVGVAQALYRIGDGEWLAYGKDGVVVSENATVCFKAVDAAGNEATKNYVVWNIDKIPPEKPAAAADVTETTTGSVKVSATFSMDSVNREFSLDGGSTWSDYTAPVEFTANGTVLFRGTDAAGNESAVETYSVTNIEVVTPDTVDPIVTNITASTTKPTNQNVTVTADFTDNIEVAQKLYKIGDGSWTNYVDGVDMTENGTVYFKAVDMSGNESSGTDSITVSNIDKVKPTITDITPSTTEKTDSVTVTANFADDVDLASSQYKIGLGDWTDYTTGVTVTANTTIYFKATDLAGNDATAQYEVTNIETTEPDTTKPEVSNIKADITTPTNGNVVVTAAFADNVGIATKQYKIGDGAWTDYVDGVTMTENGTVYFKATDTSGNESNEENFLVSNIDKIPPAKPTASASTEAPTNGSVNVSATFAGDSVKNEYSMDGTNWALYPGLVKFDDNGTVYFRATDEAGNVSDVETYSVTNIDKVPPAKPTASADITEKTTGSVTVTAVFSGDSAKKEYSLDGMIWQDYTSPIVFNANGKAYFRAFDAAGNQSEIGGYEVTNIETSEPDTTKPTVTNIAASTTALTNNNVFVTADFLDNVAVKSKLYKIGSGAWTAYADGVVVTENATVYFKAVDTSDNESDVAEYAVTNIDKVAPTITNITHSPTAPAKSVTVTADFADNIGLATKQYKIGTSGAWTDYVDGVIMTENGTVYFWAVDTAGNESSTVSHTVTNIEPTGSSITGDITGETKDVPAGWTALNVNVNTGGKLNVLDGGVASNTNVNAGGRLYVSSGGIARDTTVNDGGLIEGSGCEIDGIVVNSGGSLLLYSGAKLTGQMTFASGAEVIPFVGSILDFDLTQTEPGSPALVNDLSILMGTPTYTITVDNSQALGTYKLAGGAAGFDKPITVRSIYGEIGCTLTVDGGATKLGDVYLTLALSGSDLTFTISEDSGGGIIPDNKPDDGKNDYLYKKKADPEWNNANIHVTNEITGNGEVRLDLPGTIDTEDGKLNLFGHDKDNMDTGDVAQVEVNDPAKLTFTIDSNAAGTFFVYEDGFDKKGNRKMITVKKVTVKAGKLATLKDVCLTSTGKYYVAMTAKNVKKVGIEGLYNVNVIESKFFVDADEGANKNNTADEGKTISVGRDQDKNIVLDGNPMKGSTEFNSFVGFTDGKDYAKLDLTDSAYLKFHVTGDGDGKAKFTIWKQTKGTTGKLSKVTSVSLPAKKVYDATTKAQFLDTSKYTYYVSMECSDEAKGKEVYYNVEITDDAVFFDSADEGWNNVLYDKKAKKFYPEDGEHHFETTTIGAGTHVKLDSDPVGDSNWENFVGYQDSADYAKIELASDGNLSFDLKATGNATFVVYKKGQDKKGNDTLVAIQTTKLTVAKDKDIVETGTDLLTGLKAGEYYVSMTAKSTKANASGRVFYSVMATLDSSVSSALEMPMGAAAYADSVQDKLFGESMNGLLA